MKIQNLNQPYIQNFSAVKIPLPEHVEVDKICRRFLTLHRRTRDELRYVTDASGKKNFVWYIRTRFHSRRENGLLAELQVHDASICAIDNRKINSESTACKRH